MVADVSLVHHVCFFFIVARTESILTDEAKFKLLSLLYISGLLDVIKLTYWLIVERDHDCEVLEDTTKYHGKTHV